MGQYFGRSAVPMTGVAGVAVLPHYRGRGAAGFLMRETMRELQSRGVALSTLYPSIAPLYRSVGYETAGSRFLCSVPTVEIHVDHRAPAIRELTDDDLLEVEEVYARRATHAPGHLQRGEYIWRGIRSSSEAPGVGYAVEVEGRIEGYLYMVQERTPDFRYSLWLKDFIVTTERSARRLLTFLASHGTIARSASWFSGPSDQLLSVMPQQAYNLEFRGHWMVRVVDVQAALRARSYPPGVSGEIHLRVDDDLLPGNADDFVLRVADGRGSVERGGRGSLRADIRGLAPLFTGFLDARALRVTGQLDGSDAELDLAAAMFAGQHPWMPDMF